MSEKVFNYRKYFETYFQVKLNKKVVIHHGDEDRENNSLGNLYVLPKTLHERYHTAKFKLNTIQNKENVNWMLNSYSLSELNKALPIFEEYVDILKANKRFQQENKEKFQNFIDELGAMYD